MTTNDDLVPSKLEAVFYGILGMVIVLVSNLPFFAEQLLKGTDQNTESIKKLGELYVTRLLEYVDKLSFTATAAVFVFWSLSGIAIYSFLQAAYNTYYELKSDVDLSSKHFLHPSNFASWQLWASVFVQFGAHVVLYSLIVSWGLLFIYVLLPVTNTALVGLSTGPSVNQGIIFVAAFTLFYVGIAILSLLLKVFVRLKHITF